ncbi:hypothetical protein [Photobacterium leiognathi]|uniref:O-antigen polymerase n=1 Tax=Photobacterium leiognathi TaxID=553611 RepID=A0ABX5GDB0_PHOLE|nr:hypothetical protein [Photobacterium leiognathi]KJF91575.1 hypothetical protein UB42_01830 [Photobacterium leiognathi]PSV79947.1 hypothetical protein CTM94_14785 [Photobacterium leiognathi]
MIVKKYYVSFYISLFLVFIGFMENFGSIRYLFMMPLFIFLLIILCFSHKVMKSTINTFLVLIFFSFLLALPSYFNLYPHKGNFNYDLSDYFLGLLVKLLSIFIVFLFFKDDRGKMKDLINFVIILNVSFFLLQFILVYGTSYYLDPLYFLTGEVQRYKSNFSIPFIGYIYRPTGLYEEPSTYSAFIILLISARYYLDNKIDNILKISVFSVLLSFSVASIIYGFIVLLIFYRKTNNSYIKYLFFLFLPVLLIFLIYIGLERLGSIDTATSLRSNLLLKVFEQDKLEILFGNGMLGVIPSLSEYMKSGNLWAAGVAALNDNGLWLFIIIKFGIIGLITSIILFFKRVKSYTNRALFLIILLTKVSFLYFGFLFYLMVIINYREK